MKKADKSSFAGTEVESDSTAELLPSASLLPNPVLGDVHICFAVYGFDLSQPLIRFDYLEDAKAEITNMDDAAIIVTEVSERQKDGSLLIKQQRIFSAPQIWFPFPEFEPEYDGHYLCHLIRKNECETVTKFQKVVHMNYSTFFCEENETVTHFMIVPSPEVALSGYIA